MFENLLRIEVTLEDIAKGTRHCPLSCPIARAVLRSASKVFRTENVRCYVNELAIHLTVRETTFAARNLPDEVKTWMHKFDIGEPRYPFSTVIAFTECLISKSLKPNFEMYSP